MATGKDIADTLHELVDRDMTFMHICGTHEAAIARTRTAQPPARTTENCHGPGMSCLHHSPGRN